MPRQKNSKKLIISASITGNVIEWYEFGLFAYLTPTISKLFFPPSFSNLSSIFSVLFIFAIGFISRPLGGILFGYIGDTFGRRISLLSSVIMIIFPSFIIGLLPTYEQIGCWAPICLAFYRILQGIPVGGECPGTMCYLIECSSLKDRGFMGSFAFFGSQIGILLNIIECYILDNVLTRQQLLDWGWRCSFMIGGIIGLIGLFLRYQLKETPLFLTLEQQDHIAKAPLHKLFKECKYKMIMALFVGALPIGGFYQIFVFTSIYLEEFFRLTSNQGLLLNGAFLLVSTSILPFVGKLSSKFSIKKLFIHSALYVCALAFPFYLFVIRGYFPAAILMALLMVLCISVQFALISQAMAGLFSTSVRFTGLALSYNCSNIIFAGAFPLFSIFIVKMTGFLYAPAFSIFILALISCLTVIRLKQRGGELEVQNG